MLDEDIQCKDAVADISLLFIKVIVHREGDIAAFFVLEGHFTGKDIWSNIIIAAVEISGEVDNLYAAVQFDVRQ